MQGLNVDYARCGSSSTPRSSDIKKTLIAAEQDRPDVRGRADHPRRYERAPDCVEALGTLNRWPGRSGVPIEDYLRQWEASCAELQASALLPARLREMLRIT